MTPLQIIYKICTNPEIERIYFDLDNNHLDPMQAIERLCGFDANDSSIRVNRDSENSICIYTF